MPNWWRKNTKRGPEARQPMGDPYISNEDDEENTTPIEVQRAEFISSLPSGELERLHNTITTLHKLNVPTRAEITGILQARARASPEWSSYSNPNNYTFDAYLSGASFELQYAVQYLNRDYYNNAVSHIKSILDIIDQLSGGIPLNAWIFSRMQGGSHRKTHSNKSKKSTKRRRQNGRKSRKV